MEDIMRHVRTEFALALTLQERNHSLEAYVQYLKCLGHVLQYLRLDTQSWQPRLSADDNRNLFALARNCLEMSEQLAGGLRINPSEHHQDASSPLAPAPPAPSSASLDGFASTPADTQVDRSSSTPSLSPPHSSNITDPTSTSRAISSSASQNKALPQSLQRSMHMRTSIKAMQSVLKEKKCMDNSGAQMIAIEEESLMPTDFLVCIYTYVGMYYICMYARACPCK